MANGDMKFENVLIVSKMTGLDFDEFQFGAAMTQYHNAKNIDVNKLREEHKFHYKSLDNIVELFKQEGITPARIDKQSLGMSDFEKDWDLVIPVGGDGTYMDAARYIMDDTPVFGIKSSPYSIGGHYHTNFANAEEHIKKLLKGDFNLRKRTRIEGVVHNEYPVTDLALNEIFVGDYYNPGFAWLDIKFNGEEYKGTGSSGLVVSTYMGKTGWFENILIMEKDKKIIDAYNAAHKAAGLPARDTFITQSQFIPDEHGVARYNLREQKHGPMGAGPSYGLLKPGDELIVTMRSKGDGSVSFDGNKPTRPRHRIYELPENNPVVIKISDKPLSVIRINEH